LVNHFYASFQIPDQPDIAASTASVLTEVTEALSDIGLIPNGAAATFLNVPPPELDGITADFERLGNLSACSDLGTAGRAILLDMDFGRFLVLAAPRQSTEHDELVWYKHWLHSEGMREVQQFTSRLLVDCRTTTTALQRAMNSNSNGHGQLRDLLSARERFMEVVDSVQDYKLMTTTLETFRKGVDLDHLNTPLVAYTPGQPPPAITSLIAQESYLTLARPLETTGAAIESLVGANQIRLETLTDVSNMGYNANVQRQLTRLQLLTMLVAIATLVVSLVVALKSSSGDNSRQSPSPSRSSSSITRTGSPPSIPAPRLHSSIKSR
jgi:hypothetical protein